MSNENIFFTLEEFEDNENESDLVNHVDYFQLMYGMKLYF